MQIFAAGGFNARAIAGGGGPFSKAQTSAPLPPHGNRSGYFRTRYDHRRGAGFAGSLRAPAVFPCWAGRSPARYASAEGSIGWLSSDHRASSAYRAGSEPGPRRISAPQWVIEVISVLRQGIPALSGSVHVSPFKGHVLCEKPRPAGHACHLPPLRLAGLKVFFSSSSRQPAEETARGWTTGQPSAITQSQAGLLL